MDLTKNEVEFMHTCIENPFGSILDGNVWTSSVLDVFPIKRKQARAIISGLVKKGVIEVTPYGVGKETSIDLTKRGEYVMEILTKNKFTYPVKLFILDPS